MRAILLVLIIIVITLISAIASGYLNINQIRGGQVPAVSATANGVVAKGGQTPKFDIETGSVEVGTRSATVQVPQVKVIPPTNQAQQNAVANAQ